jgi:hypothetical protein
MRVFVLSTGRCGTTTFAHASSHITNYSTSHESRADSYGTARLDYPDDHIEVDNRLSWFLGSLDRRFGNDAFYVHLWRDPEAVARSYAERLSDGKGAFHRYRLALALARRDESQSWIMDGFGHHVVIRSSPYSALEALGLARSYVETVTDNIRLFLRDKTNALPIRIEEAGDVFPVFWEAIGATGDLAKAVSEFSSRYNAGSHSPAVV